MKYKYTILLLSIVSLVTLSCKTGKLQTTAEMIKGKWQLTHYFHKEHFVNMEDTQSHTGSAKDIVDFRSDGKIYAGDSGRIFTLPYSIEGDSILVMGVARYHITNLTDSSMKLYNRETDQYSSILYNETTYNYRR